MYQYQLLIDKILTDGIDTEDRTGVGTKSIFGHQMRFNLQEGFPIVTTKKTHFKSVVAELLWMLRGETNIKSLNEEGITIWDEWADEYGNLGSIYGKQWRSWTNKIKQTHDQVDSIIKSLKNNPNSRRHIVSAWNAGELDNMALPPCHILWQCYVRNGKLSLQVYQRSADVFLGVPFNIASYALLTHLLAQQTNLEAGDLIWSGGDCHIYNNHIDQCQQILQREPKKLPILEIRGNYNFIDQYKTDDIKLIGYDHHPHVHGDVAV